MAHPQFTVGSMFDRHALTRTFAWQPLQGSKLKRYAAALLAMAGALALRSAFQPILGGTLHHSSIAVATVFAAWYCGLGPAALSAVLGSLAANTLLIPPYRPLGSWTEKDIVSELLFLVFCAAIIAVSEGGRRALLRLGQAHDMLLRSRMQLKFRVRQRTAQLQQSNKELRDLSVRLLRVQDDERRRIARDLHDSTGQALTALKLELAAIERELAPRSPQLAGRLALSIENARQISDELRTISYLLHPPLLDELGLGSALRWYADGFEKRSGIGIQLELSGEGRLAPELEMTLFRVVQECLINIHRHSGSATAAIRLGQASGQIVLEVEDEGRGMRAEELSDSGAMLGVGLRGMRERIKDFGGVLSIASSPRGTKVQAVVPIQLSHAATAAAQLGAGAGKDAPRNGSPITDAIAKRAGAN